MITFIIIFFVDEDLSKEDTELSEDFKEMLRRELAGFKRRERLDVKKPGPPFSNVNYGADSPTGTLKHKFWSRYINVIGNS